MSKTILRMLLLGFLVLFAVISLMILWEEPPEHADQDSAVSPATEESGLLPSATHAVQIQPQAETPADPLSPEEIDARFKRLTEREKRLGIEVKRGTPLVIALPTASPSSSEGEPIPSEP